MWFVSVFVSHSVCVQVVSAWLVSVFVNHKVCVCVHACIVTMDGIEHDNSFKQAEAEVLAADFD